MNIATTRFDPMEHLEPEDHVELLNEALAIGDPKLIVNAISEIARAHGMADLARQTGISRSTLYNALSDDGNPTIETVMQVLGALKVQLAAAPMAAE